MDATLHSHLQALERLALDFSARLHRSYFPALEERLYELADKSHSNDKQWHMLQLARELKKQRPLLEKVFQQHISEGFELFGKQQLGGKETRTEDISVTLSLVSNDALEIDIASSSLSRIAETRFSETLYALNQRVAVMRGGRKLPDDGNPLGPYQFSNALQHMIDQLKLNTELTVIFYKAFEPIFLEQLADFYQAANNYLIQHGFLPNLRYGGESGGASRLVHRGAGHPAAASARDSDDDSSAQAPDAGGVASNRSQASRSASGAANVTPDMTVSLQRQQQLLQEISRLQQQTTSTPASAPKQPGPASAGFFSQPVAGQPGDTAATTCSSAEVASALAAVPTDSQAEALEQDQVPAMTVNQYQAVTTRLRDQLGDQQVSQNDGNLIDLVGMMFEFMLNDEQLPDAVKAVLSYLHTPYLKAAFTDRQLFQQADHPARQLLNLLAEAGTRWVNNEGDSHFKVFPKIKSVVRRVLTEFNGDMTLFEQLLAEMQEFNQKAANNVQLVERRAREKAEGEERLRDVRRHVIAEVRKRTDGRELPSHMIVLLLHPWADYLTFTLLRYGPESVQWLEGLNTVDDLLWSIEPKSDLGERNRMLLLKEPLHNKVLQGLATIAFDPARTSKILDALDKSQMLALQNQHSEPATPGKRAELETEATAAIGENETAPAEMTLAEREEVEKLRNISFGTWIEFTELDGQPKLRAKVAWANNRTSHYMLVDRTGKQVAMKSGLELARMLLSGQAQILASNPQPFFERALEHIVARFRPTTEK